MKISEDVIWTYALFFCAKRFLRVPDAVYVYRLSENSLTKKERSPQQRLEFWLSPLIHGLSKLDDFMNRSEFFKRNSDYRFVILQYFAHSTLACAHKASLNFETSDVHEMIKREFEVSFGERDILTAFLLADLIEQQKIFFEYQACIAELEEQLKTK